MRTTATLMAASLIAVAIAGCSSYPALEAAEQAPLAISEPEVPLLIGPRHEYLELYMGWYMGAEDGQAYDYAERAKHLELPRRDWFQGGPPQSNPGVEGEGR